MAKRITFTEEIDPGHLTLLSFSAREAYVDKLAELFKKDPDLMFISSDNAAFTVNNEMAEIKAAQPERFVEVGIAEADQAGAAAGLALCGKKVYLQGFGPFMALRSLDQVHTDIAYMDLPVRMINTHAGVTSGGGPTHYNIMDIGIMRMLPNVTVICPADANQCMRAIEATVDFTGPVTFRLPRGSEPLVYTTQEYDFEVGRAVTAVEGDDLTIIATGSAVAMAVSAANGLEKEGIHARVLDMHTVSPIDKDAIIKAAKETGCIITAEDHLVDGGLGGAVAEVIAEAGIGIPFKRLGIPGIFPPLGDMYELYGYMGYDAAGIKKTAKELLNKL